MRLLRLLKRDIHQEVQDWVTDNIISTSQAETICSRFGIDFHNTSTHSYGYYVLMTLGYLFIGLSVITVIGANWEDIPRAVRMLSLIGVTLFFNGLGLYKYRQGKVNVAISFFFLGGLLYGASIMLIAQIYHIGEHFPDGIFFWAIGVLPLALLLRSNVLMMLTMALAFTWFFVESNLNYFPLMFLIFLSGLLWQILKAEPSTILFLTLVAGVAFFAEYSLAWQLRVEHQFDFGVEHILLSAALFLLFFGVSKWMLAHTSHRIKDYGTLLNLWTLRFTIVFLFIFSFEELWKEILDEKWMQFSTLATTVTLFLVVAVGLAFIAKRSLTYAASTIVFSFLYLLMFFGILYLDKSASLSMQVLDNFILILMGVWLIVRGIRYGITHYFYLGVLTVLGNGLLRYIDFVGDYIGAAIMFAVFAGILLVVARYWKNQQTTMRLEP